MRKIAFTLLLLVTGCSSPGSNSGDPSQPLSLSGKAIGYTDGDATVEAILETPYYYYKNGKLEKINHRVVKGYINADGTFNIELPGDLKVSQMSLGEDEIGGCNAVNFSKSIPGATLQVLYVNKGTQLMGFLMQGTSKEALERAFGNNRINGKAAFRIFVKEAIEIGGSCEYPEVDIDLNLKAGWNIGVASLTGTNANITNGGDEGLKWFYVKTLVF